MNDFSCEELELIYDCLWCTISEYNDDEEGSLEAFANKIKSMIDNYCDHARPYVVSYGENQFRFCDKCKKLWSLKKE